LVHILTYSAGAHGSISGSSPQSVPYNGNGTEVSAVADTGYHFVNWSDDSTSNPRTDTSVTSGISVTANFAINTYTLTYAAGSGGSINGISPQTVNYGESGSSVVPVPNSGYSFVNWSDGSTANPRTDTSVISNISVTANFMITPYIGMSYQGGKIAYIDGTGIHGFIVTTSDLTAAQWGWTGTEITGADGTAIGTGNQNTIDIITAISTSGIAARVCNDLIVDEYSDWYLPSKNELNQLYINRATLGGFVTSGYVYYLSSSEFNAANAWGQEFTNGSQGTVAKNTNTKFRAIRSF